MTRSKAATKAVPITLCVVLGLGLGIAPVNALTRDEEAALRALCRAGLHANGGIWSSARINAAIATLAFGSEWPDGAQETAYKTCNARGYLN